LIFKRETPKSAMPWAFAQFAQWLIRPWLQQSRARTGTHNYLK